MDDFSVEAPSFGLPRLRKKTMRATKSAKSAKKTQPLNGGFLSVLGVLRGNIRFGTFLREDQTTTSFPNGLARPRSIVGWKRLDRERGYGYNWVGKHTALNDITEQ